MIAKMQEPPDEEGYKARLKEYQDKDGQIEREMDTARRLINAIIAGGTLPGPLVKFGGSWLRMAFIVSADVAP